MWLRASGFRKRTTMRIEDASLKNSTHGQRNVTLIIPARDAARTIGACLESVIAIRDQDGSPLARIVLVDDGSRDTTVLEATKRDIEVLASGGRGAGAARNTGLAAATTELVWFVDADCVAAPDALRFLVPHFEGQTVGGVSGTYTIAPKATLLERLIHEEIMVRHARMSSEVNFLATFNVLYRRSVLVDLQGFDERYLKGQDAELSFRVLEAGYRLRFERRSAVRHFHADQLRKYLRVQRGQGYWRVALHLEHRGRASGDSYSSALDHAQPFVGVLLPPSFLAVLVALGGSLALRLLQRDQAWQELTDAALLGAFTLSCILLFLLCVMQLPMTMAMVRREGASMFAFIPLGAVRAVARAIGLAHGVCDRTLGRGAIAKASIARRIHASTVTTEGRGA